MYNIVIYLYLIGVAIASLFNKKVKKMWAGERQAVKVLKEKVDPEARYIWFHAASLGEFEQGRPLIEHLRKHIRSIRYCSLSFHLRAMRCVKTTRELTSFVIFL